MLTWASEDIEYDHREEPPRIPDGWTPHPTLGWVYAQISPNVYKAAWPDESGEGGLIPGTVCTVTVFHARHRHLHPAERETPEQAIARKLGRKPPPAVTWQEQAASWDARYGSPDAIASLQAVTAGTPPPDLPPDSWMRR